MKAALRRLPPVETALIVACAAMLVAVAELNAARQASDHATLETYSTVDAASGGYRAWYELLEREGVRVDRFERRLVFLDAAVDTLVYAEPLANDPRQITPTTVDVHALEAWVRAGGRLVYVGHDDVAARTRVLALPMSRTTSVRGGRATTVSPALAGVRDVRWTTALRWKPRRDLEELAGDRAGATIVRYRFGRGTVVAAIDERPFTNGLIGTGDHARLAFALTRTSRASALIAFNEAPHGLLVPEHWWTIVPRPFAVALALAAAVLLIAFAGASLRLGPPLVPPASRDATSAEFIDSLAELLDRTGAVRKALLDACRSATSAAARAAGLPDSAAPARVAERLAPEQRAVFVEMTAVAHEAFANDAALVRGVGLAQRVRREAHARSRH